MILAYQVITALTAGTSIYFICTKQYGWAVIQVITFTYFLLRTIEVMISNR